MNYRYSWILLAALAGTTMAQHVTAPKKAQTFGKSTPSAQEAARALPQSAGSMKIGGDVVFSEDFANGMAGNNGVGLRSTDGPDGEWWVYSTFGPNGAYSGSAEIITSTSADNGFMIFQSDSGNTNWSDTTIVAAPTNWDASLVSPVIDLSATPYVRLKFQQALRYCCGTSPHFVQISTDGGNTWPTSFPVVDVGANVDPGTLVTSINITAAIAGDPTNVRIRWFHDGSTSLSSHYHWQIDDINIVELFDYDLSVDGAATSAFDLDNAMTYDSLRYSIYPFVQIRPVPLNMTLTNNGSAEQTDVTANFTVIEGGNTVLDQDQLVTVVPGETQKVFVDPEFTPPAVVGTYNVTYTATSSIADSTDNNNEADASFKVSENIYARDLGTVTAFESGDEDNGEYELCNGFHVYADATLYAVDVAIRSGGSPSPIGTPITGTLREGDLETATAETPEHELVSSELNGNNGNKFTTLRFDPPQDLIAGNDYHVCIHHFGGSEVRTGTNGVSEDQTSFIFYNGQNGLDWYFTTVTPMVRMNFDPSAGITEEDVENGVGMGQNFPNPSRTTTTVPFSLTSSAHVTLEVHDLSGKLIMTLDQGVKAAGNYTTQMSTIGLSEGIYTYTLNADGVRLTKRMTVIH